MFKVSVHICTHDPRPEYLSRTLEGLKLQTLPRDEWELLLVDNASTTDAASQADLSWHPNGSHHCVPEVGKTNALIFATRQARAPLLITVDDDNVLDADYLEQACRIAEQFPHIGVWGGSCRGEFEVPLPDWARPYLTGLVVKEIDRDYWSNLQGWSLATPYGAGMCVRRPVALEFVRRIEANPKLRQLGPCERSRTRARMSGEDSFMVECAFDCGMGSGRFARLRLTHLIGKERLTEDYIVRLYAGFHISAQLAVDPAARPAASWSQRVRGVYGFVWRWWHATPIERKIIRASRRAGCKML